MTVGRALLPLATLVVGFAAGGWTLGFGTDLLVVVMLMAATVAAVQARRQGHDFDALQKACGDKVSAAMPALLILLAIGILIGSWMVSGTIPLLVLYGVQLIEPSTLILTAFLATAAMSLVTGTSWGSVGTLGVALMGVATATGAPLPATAGAIVSGAYFGDKMSPLSDSTNICAIGAGANLYAHIRNMVPTAGPSFVLAFSVYALLSQTTDGQAPAEATQLLNEIASVYGNSWTAFLPPLVIIAGVLRRWPAAPTMLASAMVALLAGTLGHGFSVADSLRAMIGGFKVSMVAPLGHDPAAFSDTFTQLLERGGAMSMSGTLVVVFAAFLFAAGLQLSGALDCLLMRLLRGAETAFGLIAATMTAGAVMITVTSHGGVTALIVGELFQKAYRRMGLAAENLSRSLEDSVTIVEPLMPWTVSALFMATTLGVATVDYLPWAVFCYGGPFFSLFWAWRHRAKGHGLKRLEPSTP